MDTKGKKSHPVIDFTNRFREILLENDFQEVINPSIVNEEDVYKQYGTEAPLILDRSFYLAGLPRPDLGISKKTEEEIKKIAEVEPKEIQQIFRDYKEGKIEADDLVEELVKRLKISTEKALEIISLFPELKSLKPIPTQLLLRSHMTAAWYMTVGALAQKSEPPFRLFSIGPRFRKEQRQDAFHLYESISASLVIADKGDLLEKGKKITEKILSELGFKEVRFETKTATSNYYEPQTEFEIFVKYNDRKVEIGDGGLYSQKSLKNYNIPFPVFNVGFGAERIVMILNNSKDIRELVYPQFYGSKELNDKEIAESISLKESPKSERLAKEIEKSIIKHKNELGPKKFLVHKGAGIKAFLTEPEENKKLLGPAGLNVIYVLNGNILGINESDEKTKEIKEKGIRSYTFPQAISNLFASLIERKELGRHSVKMADTLPSINLTLNKTAENYITSQKKKIDVRGPVFIDLEIEKQ
jgi:O-phosphoseryl-tRNA synthetase